MKNSAEFNTEEEFRNFVTGLSENEIRNFRPDDWNRLYRQSEKLALRQQNPLVDFFQIRGALIYNGIFAAGKAMQSALQLKVPALSKLPEISPHTSVYYRQEFIKRNAELFYKLYKNFHLPSDISRSIIQLARSSAKSFLSDNSEIKQQIITVEKSGNFYTARPLIKKIARSIYKNAYPDHRILRRFSPDVYTGNLNNDNLLGCYLPSRHRIRMLAQTDSPYTVLGHELYHALQDLTPIHSALSNLNINLNAQPPEIGKLYRWNQKFYCTAKMLKKHLPSSQAFRTYERQPMEYTANLFSFAFTREIVRLCGPHNFRSPCRRPLQKLLNILEMPLKQLSCTPDGKITINVSSAAPNQHIIYQEFCQKYLPPFASKSPDKPWKFTLEDNESSQKFLLRQTVTLYKLRQKCKKTGENFLHAAFPQTFDTSEIDKKLSNIEKRLQKIGNSFSRRFSGNNR